MIFEPKEIVMEKYVGKRPETIKIEKELQVLVNLIKKNNSTTVDTMFGRTNKPLLSLDMVTGPELTLHSSNKKIEKLFQSMFGLKEINIVWTTDDIPNAMTGMTAVPLIYAPSTKRDGNSVHQNKNMTITIWVNIGLVSRIDLTPGEITAVLLHEIGHNFYHSLWHTLAMLPMPLELLSSKDVKHKEAMKKFYIDHFKKTILKSVISVDIFNIHRLYARLQKHIMRKVEGNEFFKYLDLTVAKFKSHMFEINMAIGRLGGVIFLANAIKDIRKVGLGKTVSIDDIALYNVEKHADSFAIDYGYGPELGQGLHKIAGIMNRGGIIDAGMDKLVEAGANKKALQITKDFAELPLLLLDTMFTGYPSSQNRIRSVIDRCKHGLKDKNLSPELRKQLEEQIEAYEDFYYNTVLNVKADVNENKIFTIAYMNMIEKLFNGKMDPREIARLFDPTFYK